MEHQRKERRNGMSIHKKKLYRNGVRGRKKVKNLSRWEVEYRQFHEENIMINSIKGFGEIGINSVCRV